MGRSVSSFDYSRTRGVVGHSRDYLSKYLASLVADGTVIQGLSSGDSMKFVRRFVADKAVAVRSSPLIRTRVMTMLMKLASLSVAESEPSRRPNRPGGNVSAPSQNCVQGAFNQYVSGI